jgi:hypothetical protein
VATTFIPHAGSSKPVRINPIAEQIRNLQIISCDLCDNKASFDVYFEGFVNGVNLLKRYCEQCIKGISQ